VIINSEGTYKNAYFFALFMALRPKQWSKNVLVFAAPVAAGFWQEAESLLPICWAFVGFCAVSSLGYVVNDWIDRDYDATHPTKRKRPFASRRLGIISFTTLVLILSFVYFFVVQKLPSNYLLLSAAYLLVTLTYSTLIKAIPVVEMIWLSLGFLLRPLSGAAAISIPVSEWFLIVTSFGALFLIATKRLAEFKRMGEGIVRPVIKQYSETFLTTIISVSIGISLTAYSLWAFSIYPDSLWPKISVLTVVLGMLRYAWHFEREDAESPDVIIWRDPIVIISGLSSLILIIMAVQLDG
jgi:decaprenyl-phosphate phosphoribosyltransferase